MAGTLALVGAGEFLDSMSTVDRQLLDRAGGSNVVILPTASAPDGAGVPERWIKMGDRALHPIGRPGRWAVGARSAWRATTRQMPIESARQI